MSKLYTRALIYLKKKRRKKQTVAEQALTLFKLLNETKFWRSKNFRKKKRKKKKEPTATEKETAWIETMKERSINKMVGKVRVKKIHIFPDEIR